jgi:C-terminal processing protease CtpA/Prc
MKKGILLVAGGLAALSVTLIALPSPSAAVQEQGDTDTVVWQQKLKNLDKLKDLEKLQCVQVDPGDVLESANQAVEQYDNAMQLVRELPGDLDVEQIAVLDGEEGPSWLGVETQEVTTENAAALKLPAERGVVIGRVTEDSPAAKAGLKEKDVITEVNGQRVEGAAQFRRMVHEIPAGRTAQLTVWRDGRAQSVSVTLGQAEEGHRAWMKAAPGAFAFRMPEVEMPDMPAIAGLGDDFALLPGGRPRLGIDAEDLGEQLGSFFGAPDGEGILVRNVNSGSPAEKAGLKAGDVITSFNGERVRTLGDLRQKLAAKADEKPAKLGVWRNRSEVTLTVELPTRAPKVQHKTARRTNI